MARADSGQLLGAAADDDAAGDKKWSRNEKESLGNKDLERKVKSDVGRH
jgi:hypothetical protein